MEFVHIGIPQVAYLAISLLAIVTSIVRNGTEKIVTDNKKIFVAALIVAEPILAGLIIAGGAFSSFGVAQIALGAFLVLKPIGLLMAWDKPVRYNAFSDASAVIMMNLALYAAGFYTA
jgi:hypothetical protein